MPDLRRLFMLDEQFTYLNHGAFGACPKPVFEVYQSWQRELEKQPSAFFMRRFGSIMKEARQSLGNYLGTDGENLVFVPNVTTAINMVAHSLLLEKGDEILTTSHEYGAMNRAWEFACARTGANGAKDTTTNARNASSAGIAALCPLLPIAAITTGRKSCFPKTKFSSRESQAAEV